MEMFMTHLSTHSSSRSLSSLLPDTPPIPPTVLHLDAMITVTSVSVLSKVCYTALNLVFVTFEDFVCRVVLKREYCNLLSHL